MKKVFKDSTAGLFRAENGICYVKFEKPLSDNGEIYNAAVITSGQLKNFEDISIIDDLKG